MTSLCACVCEHEGNFQFSFFFAQFKQGKKIRKILQYHAIAWNQNRFTFFNRKWFCFFVATTKPTPELLIIKKNSNKVLCNNSHLFFLFSFSLYFFISREIQYKLATTATSLCYLIIFYFHYDKLTTAIQA